MTITPTTAPHLAGATVPPDGETRSVADISDLDLGDRPEIRPRMGHAVGIA